MPGLKISRRARTRIHEIIAYIGAENPAAALSVANTITARIKLLREHPRLGRSGRVQGTRELVVAGTRYIVVYRLQKGGAVEVLHVLHSAQQWPESF